MRARFKLSLHQREEGTSQSGIHRENTGNPGILESPSRATTTVPAWPWTLPELPREFQPRQELLPKTPPQSQGHQALPVLTQGCFQDSLKNQGGLRDIPEPPWDVQPPSSSINWDGLGKTDCRVLKNCDLPLKILPISVFT